MENRQNNLFSYFSAIAVNFLSFSAANGFSWTSPTLPKLGSSDPEINPLGAPVTLFQESCIASLFVIGAVVGSLVSGLAAESLGRKKTLVLFGLPMITCFLMTAFAKTVSLFYIARFSCGLGAGAVLAVLPSYVSEISEDKNRGILGAVMGVSIALGHLFSYAVGPFVSVKVFSFLQMIPLVLLYLTFLPFVPESPYYLVSVGERARALESLKKFRGKSSSAVEKELMYIKERVEEAETVKANLRDICKSKPFVKGLIVVCGLMVIQQFGGVCAMLSYMQNIFDASGSSIPAEIAPIPVAIVQLVANIVIIFLVDRLGRKPLLLLSSAGMFASLLLLGTFFYVKTNEYNVDQFSWLPICCMIFYFVGFNLGFASLPYTIAGEIFTSEAKSMGSSICICFGFVLTCIVTTFFPYMVLAIEMSGSLWLFSAVPLMSIIFIAKFVPETKGKSIEEIQHMLGGEYETLTLK